MHKTETVDYAILIDGERTLVLDDGEIEWKPGDIVFFKNTGEKGLSHCGIFIKKNKFIHAENEKTGVVISTLSSGYYKDHYAGARRIV